jgi:hypothetical protein
MNKLKLVLIIIILFISYFYFSKPKSLVINDNGKIKGVVNNIRANVQCELFWKSQYKIAYRMNEQKNTSPDPPSKAYWSSLKNNENYQNAKKELDKIKKTYFSPEQYRAEKLREEADSVELVGYFRLVDERCYKIRDQEIRQSELALTYINSRLADAKPWYVSPIVILICIIILIILFKYF